MKIKLAVLFGGKSDEHEVSIASARSVMEVLEGGKFDIYPVGISREGEWLYGSGIADAFEKQQTESLTRVTFLPYGPRGRLYACSEDRLRPLVDLDIIFPLLHGPNGEDGTIQGYLETVRVPYVGSRVLGSAVGMDKALFKSLMAGCGIPVVPHMVLNSAHFERNMEEVLLKAESVGSYPFFVKPSNMGSSVGIHKCRSRDELRAGLQDAARYDRRILVEQGINARELEVAVLGNAENASASVVGEICPHDEFYTYAAKYQPGGSDLIIPAALDALSTSKIQDLAVSAFHAVDGTGMARVDFLADRDSGEIFLSEINTIPGFTSTSMYPRLWNASGLSYPDLLNRLVELAVRGNNIPLQIQEAFTGK